MKQQRGTCSVCGYRCRLVALWRGSASRVCGKHWLYGGYGKARTAAVRIRALKEAPQ